MKCLAGEEELCSDGYYTELIGQTECLLCVDGAQCSLGQIEGMSFRKPNIQITISPSQFWNTFNYVFQTTYFTPLYTDQKMRCQINILTWIEQICIFGCSDAFNWCKVILPTYILFMLKYWDTMIKSWNYPRFSHWQAFIRMWTWLLLSWTPISDWHLLWEILMSDWNARTGCWRFIVDESMFSMPWGQGLWLRCWL